MGLKSKTKQILPISIFERVKRIANGSLALYWMTFLQARRYNKAYAKYDSRGLQQITSRLSFFTHQIEKGLSHSNFRYGFGHRPLQYLKHAMEKYQQADNNYLQSSVYQSALAVLHEYALRHERHSKEFEFAKTLFPQAIWEEASKISPSFGGSITVTAESKINNNAATFTQLSNNRHSIREYDSKPVSYEEILPAIELAMRTPSVCNRQPTRIKVLLNPDLIRQAIKIQGGFNGYPTPPTLILITTDNRAFMTPQEHNEGFTDGGLFGMSLLLSLEEYGLAACPLNTMFRRKKEKATRKLLNIPNYEDLVMYIAVGHFPEVTKTCRSARYPATAITQVIE